MALNTRLPSPVSTTGRIIKLTTFNGRPLGNSSLGMKSPMVQRSRAVILATNSSPESSRTILEAFFYGKAFAETLNEKLGAALGDFLSEVTKKDAERRQALREFEDEVRARADAEMRQSNATPTPSNSYLDSSRGTAGVRREPILPPPPDLQETVDDLRAEVAATRAAVQAFKGKRREEGSSSNL